MKKLTRANVHSIFMDCLFSGSEIKGLAPGEIPKNAIIVQGVKLHIGFNNERIEKNSQDIKNMLSQLHEDFQTDIGQGGSFLKMCFLKDDVQWTGLHTEVDELVCLGLASNNLEFLKQREDWNNLPGGMPYLVIKK